MTTISITGYTVGIPQIGINYPILDIVNGNPLILPSGNAITEVQIKMLNDLGSAKDGFVISIGTLVNPESIQLFSVFSVINNFLVVPNQYVAFNKDYPILITSTNNVPIPEKFDVALKYKPIGNNK
jgi:hypothetical protein